MPAPRLVCSSRRVNCRGQEHIPPSGPFLLTINHYGRPGFMTWWLVFSLSASLPVEVHWVITSAWIFPGKWYESLVGKLTAWLFRQIAQVYGFTNMTPIAPYSSEVEGRARSVRRALEHARQAPQPVIGLAPEGRNHPGARARLSAPWRGTLYRPTGASLSGTLTGRRI